MSLEKEKLNQNEWVRWLLKENHKEELWNLLSFWEKYKAEWKKMEQEFWVYWKRSDYKDLLRYYEKNKKNFEWLLPEEKAMLDGLDAVAREKFYKKYLIDRIVYGLWSLKHERVEDEFYHWKGEDLEHFRNRTHNAKNRIKPWVTMNLNVLDLRNAIWPEWAKILAEEWKDSLQPGMSVYLGQNKIWEEWAIAIAEAWKGKLQPWMEVTLENNGIWDKWAIAIAEAWKDDLKPWMNITLDKNGITNEWLRAITQAWRGKLQPWMIVNLWYNNIWDEWVKVLVEDWKDSLQPWMTLGLRLSNISKKWVDMLIDNLELKEGVKIDLTYNVKIWPDEKKRLVEWVQRYKKRWTNCEVWFG